jgi:hypothetical protein
MRRINASISAIVLFSLISFAQAPPKPVKQSLPCDFHGELYPTTSKPYWFTSTEMKGRATKKVDVGPLIKQADVGATELKISLIIAVNGKVECLRTDSESHPMIRIDAERAIREWEFQPMLRNGKPTSYVGTLKFELCGVNCPNGRHMTLLD